MLVFCIKLKWVPVWSSSSHNYVLPVIALAAYPMAYITRPVSYTHLEPVDDIGDLMAQLIDLRIIGDDRVHMYDSTAGKPVSYTHLRNW